ncbi:ribonuclease III [Alloacidobacterium sp.]|uniref:ribonuclease III n=1 Tax=Alloacidobacterium sp. TaxID=2951999 RepID=UPI002D71C3CF|nr:ribonuclease III [Alloacidobacterium sp.]HYK34699.1 ribonuclease III [Alloacidobacterium sp.]
MGQPAFQPLERALGHKFEQDALLVKALTHSSLAHEFQLSEASPADQPPPKDNEQMEFLGDAVIGLLVAESLYKRFPELSEGELTRLRSALVSRKHLGQVAARLKLGKYLRLGKGEERSGGRKKAALLANCMEAVVAAIYLDAGLGATSAVVEREIVSPSVAQLQKELVEGRSIGDHKSALQEFLQAQKGTQPIYVVKGESGPDHRKRFTVEVRVADNGVPGKALARGTGTTKKKAEQEAARRALEKLRIPAETIAGEAADE